MRNKQTPMAPPGIKLLICGRPEDCGSWSSHDLYGWYIGPSLEKYRSNQIWIPNTNSVSIGKSVFWFPHKPIMPTTTATDIIIETATDLTSALRKPNKNPLLPPYNTITRRSLFRIDYIFSKTSYALKPQKHPTFRLPRVFAPKPIAAPPRVSPSTIQDFHNIFPTTQKHRRDL